MSFDSGGQSDYEGEIDMPNHVCHGVKIHKSVWTPKIGFMEWGDSEVIWTTPYLPKKKYKTLNGMLKSMKLPKYVEPKKQ